MELDMLQTFIQPEVLVLIPVLYIIGVLLRQTPNVPNWIDAWVKLVVAVISCLFLVGFTVDAFIQGILVAGGATLMKDLIDRTAEGVEEMKQQRRDDNDLG